MLKLILVKKNITMISLLFKEILKWVNSHVTPYIRGGEPIVRKISMVRKKFSKS
jgi:hypothetical protein